MCEKKSIKMFFLNDHCVYALSSLSNTGSNAAAVLISDSIICFYIYFYYNLSFNCVKDNTRQ